MKLGHLVVIGGTLLGFGLLFGGKTRTPSGKREWDRRVEDLAKRLTNLTAETETYIAEIERNGRSSPGTIESKVTKWKALCHEINVTISDAERGFTQSGMPDNSHLSQLQSLAGRCSGEKSVLRKLEQKLQDLDSPVGDLAFAIDRFIRMTGDVADAGCSGFSALSEWNDEVGAEHGPIINAVSDGSVSHARQGEVTGGMIVLLDFYMQCGDAQYDAAYKRYEQLKRGEA